MSSQIHLFIKGNVIGVGFRGWVRMLAHFQHVKGWVRNVYDQPHIFGSDGGVEAVIQGDENNIATFIESVKHTSYSSNITEIKEVKENATEEFENFEVIR